MSTSPFADAVARAEGFGIPGAIPTLANNPGDLALGDLGYGTLGNNISIFPSTQAGETALQNQINAMANGTSKYYSPNETLAQAGSTYSGGSSWATNVAKFLGIPTSATLAEAAQQDGKTGGDGFSLFGPYTLEDFIFIVIGIILIAAGIFAFDSTRPYITAAAKTAAEVAA